MSTKKPSPLDLLHDQIDRIHANRPTRSISTEIGQQRDHRDLDRLIGKLLAPIAEGLAGVEHPSCIGLMLGSIGCAYQKGLPKAREYAGALAKDRVTRVWQRFASLDPVSQLRELLDVDDMVTRIQDGAHEHIVPLPGTLGEHLRKFLTERCGEQLRFEESENGSATASMVTPCARSMSLKADF